jgi:hypothetical protein
VFILFNFIVNRIIEKWGGKIIQRSACSEEQIVSKLFSNTVTVVMQKEAEVGLI